MAVRLNAWLAETFECQLVLGNHWLQERHEQKKSGVKTERDGVWDGLYHDNGSCLEITNSIHSERNSALQVLETQPWTLTDGRHHVVAHLTPDCAQHFAARYPAVSYLSPGSTIAVRRYTIQYTSYGPPRHQLRFLLHDIEWVGVSCPRSSDFNSIDVVPLYHQGEIAAVQEQLRETRARQDRHCLSLAEAQGTDTMAGDLHQSHDSPKSGSQLASQNFHTQSPFVAQLHYHHRSRPDSDEPVIMGERSREPILAGNTKRVEIRSGQSATKYEKEQHLLQLLGKQSEQRQTTSRASSSQTPARTALATPRSTDKVAEPSSEQPLGPSNHSAHPSREKGQKAKDKSSSPIKSRDAGKDALHRISGDKEVTDSAQVQNDRAVATVPEQDTIEGPECSWMKGFIFNSETLKVSKLQQQCLTKDTSWLNPPPGRPPFQDGNMPQSILATLHMIADERASAEDEGNSDEESNFDPSPDSLPVTINLSAESVPQTTQENDDDEESIVSGWSISPEPPPKPLKSHQELPPDSSPIIQNQPTFSPLAVQDLAISDDEMEMEESIPRALGEDLTQKTGPCTDIPTVSSPNPTPPQSVVQVKETPYGKGKTAQPTDNIPIRSPVSTQTQNSSGKFKGISSTSVVQSSSISLQALSSVESTQTLNDNTDTLQKDHTGISRKRRDSQGETAGTRGVHASEDVHVVEEELSKTGETAISPIIEQKLQSSDDPSENRVTAVPSNTIPEHLQSHELATGVSGTTKRKLQASPAKGDRRHSKRREIRVVGFGDIMVPPVDPVVKLREEREESLRRFREQRNSSTSFESLRQPMRGPADEQSLNVMDLDSADVSDNEPQSGRGSPRHESLYEEPSPRREPSMTIVQSRPSHKELQFLDELRFSQAKHYSTPNVQTQFASEVLGEESHATVFDVFKAAYPEYKGDTKHFHNHCKQIYKLDLEDKMVPKWQWDDFIIRNRTDYRDYAMACLDSGEDPEPYLRFYKDNIRDTLYRRGIIGGRETLEQALEEVGIAVEDLDAPADPPSRPASSRKSLPGSFEQMRKPRQGFVTPSHARPRQSLPASSYAQQQQHHQGTPSASRQQMRPPRPSQPEPTGDPYRDYFFAVQRNTSWTGSSRR